MKERGSLRFLCLALLLSASSSKAVWAQAVDYGALEQLFGEPVTTSVTGKPQKASDAPAELIILTQDDIRRSGADNIPDVLRFVTGIDVRTYGIADSEVGIRGYNQPLNPRLLVMVNGRQIYLDDYGYVVWSTLPVQLDEIRQIEIVKGPNSALFGFNAASGVINIITFDPIKDSTNVVTVRTGTQGLIEGSVVETAHVNNAAIRLSAGGFSMRDFESIGLTAFDNADRPRPQNGTFNLEGSWQVLPNVQITAEGGVVSNRTGFIEPQGSFLDTQYRIDTMRAGAVADTRLGLLAIDLYRNQARTTVGSSIATIDLNDIVYVTKVSDLFKVDADNTIRLGVEYRNDAGNSEAFGGTIGYQVYSANAMWNWQARPSVSVTNAVRVDHLQLHFDGVTPVDTELTTSQYNKTSVTQPSFNSGVVWKVTDKNTLHLTAARGLQVPSLVDYAFHFAFPGMNTIYAGNPALTPTAVWNAEFGYDRDISWLSSVMRAAIFYQRNDNLLAVSASVPFGLQPERYLYSQSTNIGSSEEIGFELGIKGSSALGLRWNASYNYASITDSLAAGFTTTPNLDYRHGTPQHTVILGGGYSVGKWEMDAQGKWQSTFQDFYGTSSARYSAVEIPDYVTFSTRLGYQLSKDLTASGTAEQFSASRLRETAGPPVERRFILALTARY